MRAPQRGYQRRIGSRPDEAAAGYSTAPAADDDRDRNRNAKFSAWERVRFCRPLDSTMPVLVLWRGNCHNKRGGMNIDPAQQWREHIPAGIGTQRPCAQSRH